MISAYYNEIDPFAASWLRSLIAAGHIAPGDVDERSIADVSSDDLVGYGQCHFFAGIGGWSLALRLAGVPDDAPVWTGSCPCQGLSVAGNGGMRTDDWTRLRAASPDPIVDPRHLWPHFHRLITERRPSIVVGEQTASGAGRTWLTAVRADLEDLGHGVGAADLCAAGVGSPHIRQRLWWGGVRVADAGKQRLHGVDALLRADVAGRLAGDLPEAAGGGAAGGLADPDIQPRHEGSPLGSGRDQGGDAEPRAGLGGGGVVGRLADSDSPGPQGRVSGRDGAEQRAAGAGGVGGKGSRPPHVDWRAADWLRCRDGKWRPVEPGTSPLADGVPARVGRLRGYGNAIVPGVAAAFVTALMDSAWQAVQP